MAKNHAISLSYSEEKYNEGKELYERAISSLDIIEEQFNKYIKNASSVESEKAPILYEGIYLGIINNIKNSLINIRGRLETASDIAEYSKSLIDRYNSSEVEEFIVKGLLLSSLGTYSYKYLSDTKKGNALINDYNYNIIYADGYTPQGVTIVGNKVYITAYTKDKDKKSKIYVFDLNDETNYYTVKLDNNSHVGGVTYDEANKVLLITSKKGAVNAYSLATMTELASIAQKGAYEGGPIEIDLSDAQNSSIKLNSNINMNYETLANENTTTGYNSATTYYDNKSGKIFIVKFGREGKIISGDVEYDKVTGTYNIVNAETTTADSGIQGISTYHKDGKTYLVESRSYGSNSSQITVRDITNGINNSEVIGTKTMDDKYSEGIFVDNSGKATIIYEKGDHKDSTETIDINEIISEHNGKVPEIKIETDKYEIGDAEKSPVGYSPN